MHITYDTWIISDTHFLHKNIVKYSGRPENHNEIMLRNWHDLVKSEDSVLHLGDLSMGNKHEAASILRELPGQKSMLRGNHDKYHVQWYLDIGFSVVPEFIYKVDGERILFSHYPDTARMASWTINIHGHIHNNGYSPIVPSGRDYRNVSIEVMDYKPATLYSILHEDSFQSRVAAGDSAHEADRLRT